jgi:hypothetical protein
VTTTPDSSPDAVHLTSAEIVQLCLPEEKKRLGGLAVTLEPVPAMGLGHAGPGEQDLVIPRGDSNQLVLHANYAGKLDQLRHDMAMVASYVALHEDLRNREHLVGVTYRQMASLAIRGAGFRPITPLSADPAEVTRIREIYDSLKISKRQPFQLAMIHMPIDELIERFAIKRLGRDPQLLLSMVAWKATVQENSESGDPMLSALRQIADSLRSEPEA